MKRIFGLASVLALAACSAAPDQTSDVKQTNAGSAILDPSSFIPVYTCDAGSIDVTFPIKTQKLRIEKEFEGDDTLRVVWRGEGNDFLATGWIEESEGELGSDLNLEIYRYAPGSVGNEVLGSMRVQDGRGYLTLRDATGPAEELVLENCQGETANDDAPAMLPFELKGTLSYGASTDWDPPAGFTVTLSNGGGYWWVDLDTHGLRTRGEALISRNATVLVNGTTELRDGHPVLVAMTLREYVRRADAPTDADCASAQDAFERYIPPANALGITMAEGECALMIGFRSEEDHETYKAMRRAEGLSPNWHITTGDQGQQVKIAVVQEILGDVIIHPAIGVSN